MRLFHFRGTVFAGLWCIIGIGLCFLFRYHRAFFGAAVIVAALFLLCIWFFSLRNGTRGKTALLLLLLVLFCGFGAGRFALSYREYANLAGTVSGEISGRVASVSGRGEILLDRVTADGKEVPGRVRFWLEGVRVLRGEEEILGGEEGGLSEGDILTFSGNLQKEKVDRKGFRPSAWLRGVRYLAYPSEVRAETGKPGLFGGVRKYLRERLSLALKGDSYAVGLALLIGDTGEMEELDYENFQELGILHIFAVSGLHFSALFYALFRLFGFAKKWGIPVVFLILLFYAGVCDFSPSVLRAFVMICVFMGAKLLGRRYDLLSSLFCSVLVVTMIHPFHAFSPGFVLSCSGVLSIALLQPLFSRLFRFLPRRIRDAVSVCTAAQVGLVPVVSYYFGTFYTLALAVNILIFPVVGAAFVLLFAMSVLLLPFPALYFLFSAPRVLLEFLLLVSRIAETAPASLLFRVGPDAVLFGFALCWLCSDYVNLRAAAKCAACGILAALFVGAQGLGLWLTGGDRVYLSEAGALFRAGGEVVFVDSGRADGEELAEFFYERGVREVGLWLTLDTEGFLSRFAGAAEEVETRSVCFADRFSAEESGMLVYLERHFRTEGRLLDPGAFGERGGISYAYAQTGGILVKAGGLSFGFVRGGAAERGLSELGKIDALYATSCADYGTERVFCFGRGGETRGHVAREQLLFRIKNGIMTETPY